MIRYHPIPYIDPSIIYRQLPDKTWQFWLDSNDHHIQPLATNRYSYIGLDPFDTLVAHHDHVTMRGQRWLTHDPIRILSRQLAQHPLTTHPTLPPFQGGAIGYFSYDLCHQLEQIPLPKHTRSQLPLMVFAFYDVLLSFDHLQKKAWIVANGLPATTANKQQQRAQQRITQTSAWLDTLNLNVTPTCQTQSPTTKLASKMDIKSNFTASTYTDMVRQAQAYIRAGDIFEVNVSQQFHHTAESTVDCYQLYTHLRQLNPAPFSAYLAFDHGTIASASPERFLNVHQGNIEARPIKGTQPRHADPTIDQANAATLLASQKDHAENTMIVDLMRNDLSRVCLPHSIQVPQLCALESFASVHHLVSAVTGKLLPHTAPMDVIKATFPGGSITGAPKIRAMQIISELENTRRGPYCGSIGYLGFDGSMDLSMTIRSFVIQKNTINFHAGGAITLLSDPMDEYQETLDKARKLQQALSSMYSQVNA